MLSLGIMFRLLGEEDLKTYSNMRWETCSIRVGGVRFFMSDEITRRLLRERRVRMYPICIHRLTKLGLEAR